MMNEMEQEPKAMSREQREKLLKAAIRRKERQRVKYQELADSVDTEARELWRELHKIAQEELAEYEAKLKERDAKQNAAIDEIQGAIVEKNRPKGA